MSESTNKERVRELLGKGFTVLEVARHLNISPQAVYKHMRSLHLPNPTERTSA